MAAPASDRRLLRRPGLAVALATLAAMAVPAAAQDAAPPGEEAPAVLACSVNGYDVMIFNRGTEAFPPGTSVDWYVPFARKRGTHVLETGLEPEAREFLTGILANNWLDPSRACEIAFTPEPDAEADPATGDSPKT